jgi:3-oxoacyl-[acyl-carrier protein] reductase
MRLKGRVAVVTGGAQGIGEAYCLRFASEGASVCVLDLRDEQASDVEKRISAEGGTAMSIAGDVSSETSMAEAFGKISDRFGRIDVLVNNAAIYWDLDVRDQSIDYLKRVMDVNLYGVLIASRAVFPHMKEQRSGSIVNVSSVGAYPEVWPRGVEWPDFDVIPINGYGLAKSGVIFLTKAMAKACGKYGIRVNAIAPGNVLTEATQRLTGGRAGGPDDFLVRSSALDRAQSPEDMASAVAFLASEDSRQITGQTLVVDAGMVMLG